MHGPGKIFMEQKSHKILIFEGYFLNNMLIDWLLLQSSTNQCIFINLQDKINYAIITKNIIILAKEFLTNYMLPKSNVQKDDISQVILIKNIE